MNFRQRAHKASIEAQLFRLRTDALAVQYPIGVYLIARGTEQHYRVVGHRASRLSDDGYVLIQRVNEEGKFFGPVEQQLTPFAEKYELKWPLTLAWEVLLAEAKQKFGREGVKWLKQAEKLSLRHLLDNWYNYLPHEEVLSDQTH